MEAAFWEEARPAYLAFAIITAVLLMYSWRAQRIGRYRARSIMTKNELEFFYRIARAVPDHFVFPQVSLQALIEPSSSNSKVAETDRRRIAQQRADYVICEPNGRIVAVIELDDRTHEVKKDRIRDSRLRQAGVRVLRYRSKTKPGAEQIRSDLLGVGTRKGLIHR